MTPPAVRFLSAAGTNFGYREAGAGPLTVLLHGFGMDSRMWDDVVARVGPDRRCVAVDLRGAGATSLGVDEAAPLERHADDVAALIVALGEDAADIVGFSMGGFVRSPCSKRILKSFAPPRLSERARTPTTTRHGPDATISPRPSLAKGGVRPLR